MGGVWAHLADRLPPRSPSLWSPGFPRLDVASQGHGQCVGCSVTRFNGAFAYEEDGACKRPYWLPVLCTWGAHTPSLGVQNGAGGACRMWNSHLNVEAADRPQGFPGSCSQRRGHPGPAPSQGLVCLARAHSLSLKRSVFVDLQRSL